MANYYGNTKTNYFHVNDDKGFKEFVSKIVCDETALEIYQSKDKDGKDTYCLAGHSSIIGLLDEEGECDCDYDGVCDGLSKFVAEGDAIILIEVGTEKLDVFGFASVITKDKIKHISLREAAGKMADEMLMK